VDNLKISLNNKQKNSKSNSSLIWKECLQIIKQNVSNITYNTWFLPIKPFEIKNKILKIQVPNNFFIEWIEEHYRKMLEKVFLEILRYIPVIRRRRAKGRKRLSVSGSIPKK